MNKTVLLLFVVGLAIMGCSGVANISNNTDINFNGVAQSDKVITSNDFGELEMHLEALDAYQTTFTMHFKGATDWEYVVITRSNGDEIEYTQQIKGVSGTKNPGDIRLVHANGISKMVGPGTDNQCMQFPDSFDAGIEFLLPTDLINTAKFSYEPHASIAEDIAGRPATAYSLIGVNVDDWQEAELAFWLDNKSGAVLRYDFTLMGDDPLFDAGTGTITGTFLVNEVGEQQIEPVDECLIILPITDDASEILQLPGLVVFHTNLTVDDLEIFYHSVLLNEGWQPRTLPQSGEGGELIISYDSDTLSVDIKFEPIDDGKSKVELYYTDR